MYNTHMHTILINVASHMHKGVRHTSVSLATKSELANAPVLGLEPKGAASLATPTRSKWVWLAMT